ncbi:MAG: hypothetical protein IPP40_14300 [bacterium]|nr:hypothetical protein [bacterium]
MSAAADKLEVRIRTAAAVYRSSTNFDHATIGGGRGNRVSGYFGTISGGQFGNAGEGAFVGGGYFNSESIVIIGGGITNNPAQTMLQLAVDTNAATGISSHVGGGYNNQATDRRSNSRRSGNTQVVHNPQSRWNWQ